MPDAWQSAWVEILPDFKNFKSSANSQMSGVLGAAGTAGGLAAGRNIGTGMLGGIKGIAGPLIGVVAALGIGKLIGDAISAGISYALDSVDLASDLEQSTGAVRSVFKEQSSIIEGFATDASKNVGLATTSYQTFATVVGAQLKNLGIPFDEIAGQTDDLIGLGADLAAQFGGSTSDAVNALSSLLRGERDPVERYGVSIKQSDINARLAAQGLGELTGEAKKQAEIQATLAILIEQTADAQGTFARESDTLAGQQQRLQSALTDTQTAFGVSLLPAFTSATIFANETLVPALDRVTEKVGPVLAQALEDSAPAIEELIEALEPLVIALVDAAVIALPPLIEGLTFLAEHAPGFIEAFNGYYSTLVDLQAGFRGLTAEVENFLSGDGRTGRVEWLKGITDGVVESIADIGIQLAIGVAYFENFISDVQTNIENAGDDFKDSGEALIKKFAEGITAGIIFVAPAAAGVMEFLEGFFPQSPARRGPFSGSGWAAVGASGAAIAEQFASGFNSRPPINLGVTPQGLSLAGIQSGESALTAALGGRGTNVPDVTQHFTVTDQDPRLLGRQVAREFQREMAG